LRGIVFFLTLSTFTIHTQMSLFGLAGKRPGSWGGRKEDGHGSSGVYSDWALGSPLLCEGGCRGDGHDYQVRFMTRFLVVLFCTGEGRRIAMAAQVVTSTGLLVVLSCER